MHVAAGRDRALVVGDFLIVAAFDVIGEMRGSASEGAFAASVNALSKGAQLCCFGQLEELDPRDRVPAEAHYLDVVAQKTGSLFAAAATLGALAAGADPEGLATLAALGTQLGVAYQIRDDLRDREGNERRQRESCLEPGARRRRLRVLLAHLRHVRPGRSLGIRGARPPTGVLQRRAARVG